MNRTTAYALGVHYAAMMCLAIAINLVPVFLTALRVDLGGAAGLTNEQLGRLGAIMFAGLVGGILLSGPGRLPVGSHCGVAILLADGGTGQRIVTRATVIRSDARGMAIAFSRALDRNSEDSLRALIHSLDPEPEGPGQEPTAPGV